MSTIDMLRQSAPGLASLIEDARESELRRVAAVVARAVVSRTGLSHPIVDRALQRLDTAALPDADLQASVRVAAEELDEKYFAKCPANCILEVPWGLSELNDALGRPLAV
jgi:hypothetical protein